MLRSLVTGAFIAVTLVPSVGQEARAACPKPIGESLRPILEVLDRAKLSGSLSVSGRCVEGNIPDLPQFRASATSGAPLHTLRGILADDPGMRVRQDRPGGEIRMMERGVPTDVLNVRISHISFDQWYDPRDGVSAILHTPEVVAFMKARDIKWPFHGSAVRGNPWPPEHPHLSGSLENVTVREVLDHILKTFPGIWVYENCPRTDEKNRTVYFGFWNLKNLGPRDLCVEKQIR